MNTEHNIVLEKLNKLFEREQINVRLPPPVFNRMKAEVIKYDEAVRLIIVQFPVFDDYSNPFGYMQGGMVAAAVDNTFGPLSMLHAPKNYTRNFDIKFKKTIKITSKHINVEANIDDIKERQVYLNAKVFDEYDEIVAIAKATNWIV